MAHPEDPSQFRLVTGLVPFTHPDIGLSRQTRYPKPRIGIPNDIKTNPTAAAKYIDFYAAFYLAQVDAFDADNYLSSVVQWADTDFPPVYFSQYPFIGVVGSLSHQY